MVILGFDHYIINGDGSQRSDVQISMPNNDVDYAYYMQTAVVAGQFYLFGGMIDVQNVSLFIFLKN